MTDFFAGKKYILGYGLSLALLLLLLNWLKLRLVIIDHAFEVYLGTIALIFTGLGIWLALTLARPKVKIVVVEKEIDRGAGFTLNEAELEKLHISKRELEVLQLMAQGLSNQEIAMRLFVSLSTIKTHSNNLYEKMGVARRTQAIDKGKKLGIIP